MDLISRKSVAEKMARRRDYVGRPSDPDCIIADEPSVPAVPLDKLCEWLSSIDKLDCKLCKTTVGLCKAEDSMNICHSKERWKKILLKWMEEQCENN